MDDPAFAALNRMGRIAFRVMRFTNQGGGRRVFRFWQRWVITPLIGLFILGWVLIRHHRLGRQVSFPVRSNFFYETPLGLLMAVLFTGGSMFPPFFRSAEKKGMSRISLGILLEK